MNRLKKLLFYCVLFAFTATAFAQEAKNALLIDTFVPLQTQNVQLAKTKTVKAGNEKRMCDLGQ